MGSGSYWAVVYGCKDISKLRTDEKRADELDELLREFGIQQSYEGSSQYAGVVLLCTLRGWGDGEVPSGVMSIDELPAAIKRAAQGKALKRAETTWRKAQAAAAKIGMALPEGGLLWLGDYD